MEIPRGNVNARLDDALDKYIAASGYQPDENKGVRQQLTDDLSRVAGTLEPWVMNLPNAAQDAAFGELLSTFLEDVALPRDENGDKIYNVSITLVSTPGGIRAEEV